MSNQVNYSFDDAFNDADFLEHYGRLGMKWYQHIFGKARDKYKSTKRKLKAANTRKKKAKAKAKAEKEEAKKEDAKKEASKSPRSVRRNKELFTKDELDTLIKDFKRDADLKDISKRDFDRGVGYIKSFADAADGGVKAWNSLARTYNAVKKWQSLGSDDDKRKYLPIIPTGKQDKNNDDKNDKNNKS